MPVIMDPDKAMEILSADVNEMEERYIHLERSGYSNISDYNAHEPEPMTRRIVVIDEYADLIMNKTTKEELEAAIQKIGQKGRAAGFHLILATQRPDSKIITGVIKANLQLKIALKVTSATNSRIILDESGAECLAGYGDMLIGGSVPIQRLQGALVSPEDYSACLRYVYNGPIEQPDRLILNSENAKTEHPESSVEHFNNNSLSRILYW